MLLRTITFAATARLALLAVIVSLAACSKSDRSSVKVFSSPDAAGNALLDAARSGDQNELLAIFGPQSKELIFSGDPVQDKAMVTAFAPAYEAMHRWRKMADDSKMLIIGVDNFGFPIPLKKNERGQWFFNTAAGKD